MLGIAETRKIWVLDDEDRKYVTTSNFLMGEERDTNLVRRTTVVFGRDFITSAGIR